MKTNKKILIFGAHPDDVEFGCGGLVIKEIEKGTQVKIVICSLGEAGTNGTPDGRKAEAKAAAEFVGADIEFLDIGGDSHIEVTPRSGIALATKIREFKPSIVLAQSLSPNQHPDHYAMAQIVRNATRLARYGGLGELKSLPVHNIDALYFYPSSAELEGKPDIIVDVSAQAEKWVKAMEMHASQMKTRGYVNLVMSKAKAYGGSIGVEYALPLWVNNPVRVEYLSDLDLSSRNY